MSFTSSQSSTPTPYNVGNGVLTSSDGRWNQVHSNNMLQNTTPPQWNELPPQGVVSVPVSANNDFSEYNVNSRVNNVNIISNQVVYPPNYMNISNPSSSVSNGYVSLNPTRDINPQIINGQNLLRTQNGQIIGGPGFPNQPAFTWSPGWNSKKTTGGVKKPKRIRTAFTTQQMMELEQEYARTRYLDRARRMELADLLRLNERTIKIWYQNRRMKEKKDRAESMEESEGASTSESSPEVNNIQMPMLIQEQYPGCMNEVYNQGTIYLEQYPVTSTPVSIPPSSLATSTPPQSSVQNMYENFMSEEKCQALQYQQVHPYQAPYTEVQKLSPEVEPKDAPATSSPPSSVIEKSWDMSWLGSLNYDEDY